MLSDKMSLDDALSVLSRAREIFEASIKAGNANAPFDVQVITLDLSTAKLPTDAYKISFPFKSLYIQDASDSNAQINVRYGTSDSFQSLISLSLKDSLKLEYGTTKAELSWDAQAGKTITLVFLVSGFIESGTKLNTAASSVEGNSINDFPTQAFSSATATLLDSSSRNVINIVNEGPDECYVGGSGVDATPGSEKGLLLNPGDERSYRNTADIYIAVNGSCVIRKQTEF